MKFRYTTATATLAVFLMGFTLSIGANAGCSDLKQGAAPEQGADHAGIGRGQFIRTLLVRDEDRGNTNDSIVGLWKFEMLSRSTSTNTNPMPDGVLIDFGTAAWHVDGTELMNSGSRNPADGNFCQGVWARVGASTFVLNHFAISWSNGSYVGPANITERVTVDPTGSAYSGNFKLTQYLATVTPGHEFDQTTPLVTITGTVTGSRVNAF